MKEITTKFYQCEICEEKYPEQKAAVNCESKPLSQDKGVKVGDVVLVTQGEGTGEKAVVTSLSVVDQYWGHHAWKRYWHTRTIMVDLPNNSGSRFLTFDDYVVCREG